MLIIYGTTTCIIDTAYTYFGEMKYSDMTSFLETCQDYFKPDNREGIAVGISHGEPDIVKCRILQRI